MEFFKKLFGGKKDGNGVGATPAEESTFTCENCGQEKPLSQKKAHTANEMEKSKNVCEFC